MEWTVGCEFSQWRAAFDRREHDAALSHHAASGFFAEPGPLRSPDSALRSRARLRDVPDSVALPRSQACGGMAVRLVLRAGRNRAVPHRVRARKRRSFFWPVYDGAGNRGFVRDWWRRLDVPSPESAR